MVITRQYGETNGRAKLTDLEVKQIRRLKTIGLTTKETADLWNISQQYVSDIWTRRRRKKNKSVILIEVKN